MVDKEDVEERGGTSETARRIQTSTRQRHNKVERLKSDGRGLMRLLADRGCEVYHCTVHRRTCQEQDLDNTLQRGQFKNKHSEIPTRGDKY